MAYDHSIVSIGIELAAGGVRDGDVVESVAGFEGKFGDDRDCLIRYERREGILGLGGCAF